ncbi:putative ABC transport system ATP-binding protein [Austwickia chelonae]|uniref:Putative ABC transporter ATP-binding protein n=1 Tax=Austwickia chelonae NBRC 105200 TaxID=1184607 RepID=K6VT63_9MICO|nr:ABC transporter ATP-binding protein [Austwickia chelonae]GAB78495.1 putative ABC transporter ATP-binding protein [Austwickia chelonae NBRC 105200]SEW40137.1 putative ABC transport system ATP-binding protein [Austwickia chelonae]
MNETGHVIFRKVYRTYGTGAGEVHALRALDVDIPRGGFTAVMGPSGSGKSTFMNVASGLDQLTSGEAWVAGHPLHTLNEDQKTLIRRREIGFVFQSFNLIPTLTVRENIHLPFELAGTRIDQETRSWIDHLITVLGLGGRATHRPGELSGGQQQRVAVARALAGRPAVIFADEPTGNLDTRSSAEVLTLLRTAVHEYNQTIIMVSHDPVAASHADRVLVLADGQIVADHGALSPHQISDMLINIEGKAA